jgi:hypothetical protein
MIEKASALGLAHFKRVVADDFIAGIDRSAFNAIYVQRDALTPEQTAAFISTASSRGIKIVLDLDDDLVTVGHGAAHRQISQLNPEISDGLEVLAGAAETVIVSTPELAKRLGPIAREIEVFENRLDPRIWDTKIGSHFARPSDDAIRAVYIGTTTHTADLALLEGVFADGFSFHGRKVLLDVIGVTPDNKAWFQRLQPTASEYPDFIKYLRINSTRWDVALAPLVDDYFNAAKSDLKLLEYAALGLPTVASNVGPYRDHLQPSVVVDNTTAAWKSGITKVLAKSLGEVRLGGTQSVANRAMSDEHVRRWVETITR